MATTSPRLNEPWPKCTKYGMFHKIENCGIKCYLCSGLSHSEDRCWKKPKDGKSHFGATNILEVLLKRRPYNNLTSSVGMRIFSLTFECLGGGCMLT